MVTISLNTWYQSTIFSFISGLISFFVFLFMEIIFGDVLKDTLDANYQSEMYFNINIILYLGLGFVFLASWFLNYVTLRKDYLFEPIIVSNGFVLILTSISLFFISWISVVIAYSEQYQALSLVDQIKLIPHYYCLFSIYILPNPVLFWILGFIFYHLILIFFMKFFYVKKSNIKRFE